MSTSTAFPAVGPPRPLYGGYSHVARRYDRVYVVQTRDSGVERPRVLTQLFFGGKLLATLQTDYEDLAGQPDEETLVRERMLLLHRRMLRHLRGGKLDQRIAVQVTGAPGVTSEPTYATPRQVTAQEARTMREGVLISKELGGLAVEDGPVPHPLLGQLPVIELDALGRVPTDLAGVQATLPGLGELGTVPEPAADEDASASRASSSSIEGSLQALLETHELVTATPIDPKQRG